MKKWVIGFLIIAGVAVGSVYFFIPSTITVSSSAYINTFHNTIGKFLASKEKINQCLQTISTTNDSTFNYKGFNYKVSKLLFNAAEISIFSDDLDVKSHIIPVEVTVDSSALYWSAEIKASANPITRIIQYFHAKKLKESMTGITKLIGSFLEAPENMYGIVVKEIQLKDSILISTKATANSEPSVTAIYSQIKKLVDYAGSQNASATNSPMLNVQRIDDTHFQFMVGLPISKQIEENKDIRIKRMPYNGNMFVTEIKGGPATIKNGLLQLGNYLTDSKRSSPAIPYELLITNRALVSDTAKWVTKLYYPVM